MDFRKRIRPVPRTKLFTEEGYYIWDGSVFKFKDTYYMVYSRWDAALGFDAWVTDSAVCLAKADSLDGPFVHVKELFDNGGNSPTERRVTHNPTVLVHEGRIYVYFMMNYGTGDWWEHRNRQRVGVAYTDDPEGEWVRLPNPVIDITPGGIDSLMTSNPTATVMPDGKILMVYKAVSNEGQLPKGGAVICGAAVADSPLGPFRKYGKPLFANPEHPWSVEDPYIWYEDGWYYALAKDFNGYFTKVADTWSGSTALFRSQNGLDWEPDPEHPLAYLNELEFEDGNQKFHRLERPQLYFEDGKAKELLCACLINSGDPTSYNVRIPLEY